MRLAKFTVNYLAVYNMKGVETRRVPRKEGQGQLGPRQVWLLKIQGNRKEALKASEGLVEPHTSLV